MEKKEKKKRVEVEIRMKNDNRNVRRERERKREMQWEWGKWMLKESFQFENSNKRWNKYYTVSQKDGHNERRGKERNTHKGERKRVARRKNILIVFQYCTNCLKLKKRAQLAYIIKAVFFFAFNKLSLTRNYIKKKSTSAIKIDSFLFFGKHFLYASV